jgi:type I restriction enzyme S subunit
MGEKKKVPEIRLKGFDDEWKECKLEGLASFSKGQGYSKSDLVKEGTPIVLYGRLYTKYQTVISDVDTMAIDKEGSIYSTGQEVVVPASGETAEDIARASAIVTKNILIGGDLNIIYPHDKIDSIFLALNISNGKEQKELIKRAQGKSVVHIRNSDLKNVNLCYPNKNEQSKIGAYFQNIDKLISLHQDKYNKLVTLKKAMLEKMFPKKGSDIPEIRYKGFEGKWEERKLGTIVDCYSGGTPSVGNKLYYGGGIPFIRSGEISSYSTELFLTENGLLNSSAKLVSKGDILYALYGATSGEVGISNINGAINQAILAIKPKHKYDAYFLAQWLRKQKKSIVTTFLQGGQGNLSGNIVKNLDINMPKYEEQIKIGIYFQNLDKLITLNEKELERLKTIKKACLEKMFV